MAASTTKTLTNNVKRLAAATASARTSMTAIKALSPVMTATTTPTPARTGVSAVCGDGVRRTDLDAGEHGYEACDDGNQNNDDACRNDCTQNQQQAPTALIDSGFHHTCVVRDPDDNGSGSVWCWGDNRRFQLGRSNDPNNGGMEFAALAHRTFPAQNQEEQAFTALGAGDQFTHVVTGSDVWTWGSSHVTDQADQSRGANGLGHGNGVWQRQTPTQLPAARKTWGTDTVLGVAGGFAFSAFRTATHVYIAGCVTAGMPNNGSANCGFIWWSWDNQGSAHPRNSTASVDMAVG